MESSTLEHHSVVENNNNVAISLVGMVSNRFDIDHFDQRVGRRLQENHLGLVIYFDFINSVLVVS